MIHYLGGVAVTAVHQILHPLLLAVPLLLLQLGLYPRQPGDGVGVGGSGQLEALRGGGGSVQSLREGEGGVARGGGGQT